MDRAAKKGAGEAICSRVSGSTEPHKLRVFNILIAGHALKCI